MFNFYLPCLVAKPNHISPTNQFLPLNQCEWQQAMHFIICATLLMRKTDLMVVLNVPFLMALGNGDSLQH